MSSKNKYVIFLALMTAFSLSLFFLEMIVPRPLPFMKIGLSNIIILYLVFKNLYKEALLVAMLKVFMGGFFSGVIFTPMIVLSFGGSLLSCILMIFCHRFCRFFSIIGVSIIGSFVHLLTQLVLVRMIIIKSDSIFKIYPLIGISSIITGMITGVFALIFLKHLHVVKFTNLNSMSNILSKE